MKVETLSDSELTAALVGLAAQERSTTGRLVAHLAEFDCRRLYLPAGFPSLFAYCREVLRLSEQAAYHRIVAARATRRFPALAAHLDSGTLNLSTLRLLAPHLTAQNHVELSAAALGKSKREVEDLVACRFPQPDQPGFVRKVTSATPDAPLEAARKQEEPAQRPSPPAPAARSGEHERPIAPPPPIGPAPVVARAEDRYEFRFGGSGKTRDNFEFARSMLRHAVPDGSIDAIMDRALEALVEKLARSKFAATSHPREGHEPLPGKRHIIADVARSVWKRDGGRCAFLGRNGRRCDSTAFLEFHHLEPYGAGGPATVENIALRCRAHNLYEAEVFYLQRRRDELLVREPRTVYPVNSPRGELPDRTFTRSGP